MIRQACALAALLALILQGSSGGHMLLVEHARCAEHGELVHGGEAHHHGTADHRSSGHASWQIASDERLDEGHEHCALSADHRDALIAIAQAKAGARLIHAPQESALLDLSFTAGPDRLRLAPKSSPPA